MQNIHLHKFMYSHYPAVNLILHICRLHDTIQENPEYAGYIIPPPPPRPDFDASREKLRKLGDAEGRKPLFKPYIFLNYRKKVKLIGNPIIRIT